MKHTFQSSILSLFVLLLLLATCANAQQFSGTSDLPACFFSTQAIIQAQLLDPPLKSIKICANTTIEIGIPADATFTNWIDGEPPLTILHDDVTVQCGDDGLSTNNCALMDGWVQVITTPNNPFAPGRKITTNHLTIKGLTFTGRLTTTTFLSAGVALSAPGTGMVLEDVVFDDFHANQGVYLLRDALSAPEDMPAKSAEVTIIDAQFKFSSYEYAIFHTVEQTMNVEFTDFEEVVFDDHYVTTCNCTGSNISALALVERGDMKLRGCNFDKVEFYTSVLHVSGEESKVTANGNLDIGAVTLVEPYPQRLEEVYCETGVSTDDNEDFILDGCFDFWRTYTYAPGAASGAIQTCAGLLGFASAFLLAALF